MPRSFRDLDENDDLAKLVAVVVAELARVVRRVFEPFATVDLFFFVLLRRFRLPEPVEQPPSSGEVSASSSSRESKAAEDRYAVFDSQFFFLRSFFRLFFSFYIRGKF